MGSLFSCLLIRELAKGYEISYSTVLYRELEKFLLCL